MLFEQRYSDMKPSDYEEFVNDPLIDTSHSGHVNSFRELNELDTSTENRVLCIESFILNLSPSQWRSQGRSERQEYFYFKLTISDVDVFISVISPSELCSRSQGRQERQFLLLARYIEEKGQEKDWAIRHLLLLKSQNGNYERSCTLHLKVPKVGLWVLWSIGLERKIILLA